MKKLLGLTSILLTSGFAVLATSITPTYDTFGTLSGATFGGSGIPNNAVAITTFTDTAGNAITLGLTATQRYANPAVGNNGAGTFSATSGLVSGYAKWNFDYYVSLVEAVGQTAPASFSFTLKYGNNTTDTFNTLNFGSSSTTGVSQDSWNLNMGFLSGIGFDANAAAQYGFELEAFNAAGASVGKSAINVNVGTVPDTASTGMLFGLGFAGLMVFGIRQNRLQVAK